MILKTPRVEIEKLPTLDDSDLFSIVLFWNDFPLIRLTYHDELENFRLLSQLVEQAVEKLNKEENEEAK